MSQMVTITSKRQLTIPVKLFKRVNLKEGDRVIVREEAGIIKIESAVAAVKRLAGSLRRPKRFAGISDDDIIDMSAREHYSKKYKK